MSDSSVQPSSPDWGAESALVALGYLADYLGSPDSAEWPEEYLARLLVLTNAMPVTGDASRLGIEHHVCHPSALRVLSDLPGMGGMTGPHLTFAMGTIYAMCQAHVRSAFYGPSGKPVKGARSPMPGWTASCTCVRYVACHAAQSGDIADFADMCGISRPAASWLLSS